MSDEGPALARHLLGRMRWYILPLGVLLVTATFVGATTSYAAGVPFDVTVRVTIQRVIELGCLDGPVIFGACTGNPDFYAVVTIDGTEFDNKDDNDATANDDDITPNWEFSKAVDIGRGAVPLIIEILDEDGGLRFDDDRADIRAGAGERLFLDVTLAPCSVSGSVSGSCGTTIVSASLAGNSDDAEVRFKIDVVEPPSAPGRRVRCLQSPIWPQGTDTITITAESLDGALAPRVADSIEIWVNDQSAPASSGSGISLTLTVGPFLAGIQMAYGCRVVDDGVPIFSGWRTVSIGVPTGSNPIPILFTGPRSSTIDIVFIPDRDSYSGPFDPSFISDVESVISKTYYSNDPARTPAPGDDIYLRNQDRLGFWLADRTGDAEDDCDLEAPSNWDEDYSFAEVGAILHTDFFRDCALPGERLFSAEPRDDPTTSTLDYRVILHETGHQPFGLADEYCDQRPGSFSTVCDGGYFQNNPFPNLYEDRDDCQADAPSVGRTASACQSFVEEVRWWFDNTWSTSDPASNDLMVDNRAPQALDLRRMDWLFGECNSASCEVGGAAIPGGAPEPLGPGTDPTVEPIPEFDFDDPAKSIVVRLDFNSRTEVAFDAASVSLQRGHANLGDPPLLLVELFDDAGAFFAEFNAWHPLWAFAENADGSPGLSILPSANGRFVLPFHPDLATMKVTDVPLNQELIEVDLTPAIRSFCEENPTDPDCDISNLAIVDVTALNPPPLTFLGDSADVTVRTVITNHGPEAPMDAVLTMTTSAPAGVTVTPAAVSQTEAALGLNEKRQADQGYTIECLQTGDHVVTFTSQIDALPAAVSDPDLTNNEGDVALTVGCTTPRDLKERAIAELEGLRIAINGGAIGVGDQEDAIKGIEKAIRHIEKSLSPDLWVDSFHLDEKHGHKVFSEEKKAVKHLMKILEGKATDPAIAEEVAAVIDKLLDSDKRLVETALQNARDTAVDDPKKQDKVGREIEKAEEELAKALEELEKAHFDKAIDHYRHAWEHVIHAIKHARK